MKERLKRTLKARGIYDALKYSKLFHLYTFFFKRNVLRQHKKEVALYKAFLGPCDLIFDIGAYDGHKTAAFLELSKTVVSCEPDPANFKLLKTRFRNRKKRVKLQEVALSDHVEEKTFFVHQRGSAFNTLNPGWKEILEKDDLTRWNEKISFLPENNIRVRTTTLDLLIGQYGAPDFIKIDVEGYEQEVFGGLSQKVPCVSFECLLPEFKEGIRSILERLISFDPATRFNVIHDELLLFPVFVDYEGILRWLDKEEHFSFDLVAKS